MKFIAGRVNFEENYANDPRVELLVDAIPELEEMRFRKNGSIYFAELDGCVRYFSWGGRPDTGYGGASFELAMEGGGTETLVGPWSGNSFAASCAGFMESAEVCLTDDPAAYERGHTFYGGAASMDWLRAVAPRLTIPPTYGRQAKWGDPSSRQVVKEFPEGSRVEFHRKQLCEGSAHMFWKACVRLPTNELWVKGQR